MQSHVAALNLSRELRAQNPKSPSRQLAAERCVLSRQVLSSNIAESCAAPLAAFLCGTPLEPAVAEGTCPECLHAATSASAALHQVAAYGCLSPLMWLSVTCSCSIDRTLIVTLACNIALHCVSSVVRRGGVNQEVMARHMICRRWITFAITRSDILRSSLAASLRCSCSVEC